MSALCEAVCGVRIEQFFRFVNAALNIGDRFGGEVVQMARTDFLTELQQETEDDLQTVTHLLALLSLADRGGSCLYPGMFLSPRCFPGNSTGSFLSSGAHSCCSALGRSRRSSGVIARWPQADRFGCTTSSFPGA